MTPADITRLMEDVREAERKATPGPWVAENMETREDGSPGNAWGVDSTTPNAAGYMPNVILHDFVGQHDAELIALYRTAAPQLVAVVERLEQERDEARRIARRWHRELSVEEIAAEHEARFVKDHAVIASWPSDTGATK